MGFRFRLLDPGELLRERCATFFLCGAALVASRFALRLRATGMTLFVPEEFARMNESTVSQPNFFC